MLFPVAAVAQQTTRVDVDSYGVEANDYALDLPVVSADGRLVLFASEASNLVANDANGVQDVFVHDRETGITECISVDPSGVPGNAASGGQPDELAFSSDGRYVSFVGSATNLVVGRTTNGSQIFVRDRSSGTTELVSLDSIGVEGNGDCGSSCLSADGNLVAFESGSSNLVAGDTNGGFDVFVHDRTAGTMERVSVDSSGTQGAGSSNYPAISADGRFVSFSSFAANLVSDDKNGRVDAFVRDRQAQTTERISVDSSGVEGNDNTWAGKLSSDGRIVVMTGWASNLVPADANGAVDVFIRDRAAGLTERMSVDSFGGEANGSSFAGTISTDGNTVAFVSRASNLVAGDTNAALDGFLHDHSAGLTSRWSVDSLGGEGNEDCWHIAISADGRVAAFASEASNLVPGDTNGDMDIFVRDNRIASWLNYGAGLPGTSGVPAFSSSANPIVGTSITLGLDNSYQQPTVGLLFAGLLRADLHSSWGGDLLVAPILTVPITFSYGGDQFDWSIPLDYSLLGVVIELQAIEADPGAVKGVSFTPGLELAIGF